MADESLWQTGQASDFDEFEILVKDARFGYHEKYVDDDGEPRKLLIWTYDDVNEEEREHLISVGSGWDIVDNGARVEVDPESDTKIETKEIDGEDVPVFNPNTLWGRYIERFVAKESPGLDMGEVFGQEGRSDPRMAAACIGMKFYLKTEEKDFGGEIGVKEHLMPQEFLGIAGKAESGTAKESSADEAKAEKKAMVLLRRAAKDVDSAEDFQSAALDLDLPDSISERIFDDDECEALYEELTS